MAGVGLALAIRKQILKKPMQRQLQLTRQYREKFTTLSNERQAGLRRAYDAVLGDKVKLRAQIKELAKVAGCDPAVVKFYFSELRKKGKYKAKRAEPKSKAAAKAYRDNPKKKKAAQAYRDNPKNKAAAQAAAQAAADTKVTNHF